MGENETGRSPNQVDNGAKEEKEESISAQLNADRVLCVKNLQGVWRAIKKTYQGELLRDPLDLLAFEANLDSNLKQLAFALREGTYRPVSQTLIRAAKRDGMTRPLSFLDIVDTIVLKAITDALQSNLHEGFPPCVGFSRSHQKAMGIGGGDYESWFQAWLRHRGVVEDLIRRQGCAFMVESDISNFFATINHSLLRQYVSQRSRADDKLTNLLFFMLESMTWRPEYSENLHMGIPQENYDASRILAHGFLYSVDQAFQGEIDEERYARWVDDFVITVQTENDGKQVLQRLQQALEDRGLFPNSAKSKIVKVEEFCKSLYPELNDFLDRVHKATEHPGQGAEVELAEFEDTLLAFIETPRDQRLKTWDRVLRRFYTESRRIGSSALEQYALSHLQEFPASAEHILRYLLGRPFRREILSQILDYLGAASNMYEDVEIRAYEFLLEWSIPVDETLSADIADRCRDHFFARNDCSNPLTEHTRGLIALALYKFGGTDHISDLRKLFAADRVHDPCFTRNTLVVLAGTDYWEEAFTVAARLEDRATRRLHSFLVNLNRTPGAFESILRRYVRVRRRTHPERFFLSARMLPLVRLVRRDLDFRPEWDRYLETLIPRLEYIRGPLQDQRSIQFIRNELARV